MTINICPITQEPIKDPVFAPDFYTYERSALEQWLRTNPTSPMTRQPMRIEDLKKKVIQEDPIPCDEDYTTPLLAPPITITSTIVAARQIQTPRQAQQQQKMFLLVCPVVIGVIILIFLIRTIM
jgi:hypothetical protein